MSDRSGYIISVLNQKGGVGKSTISRLLGTEFARMDDGAYNVKIADTDHNQTTTVHWLGRRNRNGFEPEVRVEQMRVERAIKDAPSVDVTIIDGAPAASVETKIAAKASDLIVVPCGLSTDDMLATVQLLHELRTSGISMDLVRVVLTRTGRSEKEDRESREYLAKAGYGPNVLKNTLSEQVSYRQANDVGLSVAETKTKSLNQKAHEIFLEIIAPLTSQEAPAQTTNAA